MNVALLNRLPMAAFMHHDNKDNSPFKHYTALEGLTPTNGHLYMHGYPQTSLPTWGTGHFFDDLCSSSGGIISIVNTTVSTGGTGVG